MKKFLVILIVLCLALTGCNNTNNNVKTKEATTNTTLNMKVAENEVLNKVADEEDDTNEEATDWDEYTVEPWTLETFLEDDIELLSEVEKEKVQLYLDKINDLEKNMEATEEDLNKSYDELFALLETFDLDMTFYNESEVDNSGEEEVDTDFIPWTVEEYLGSDYDKLSKEQITEVEVLIEALNELEKNYDDPSDVFATINSLLRTYGLEIALSSYSELIELNPDAFTSEEAKALLALDAEMDALYENDPESEDLETAYETLEKLLEDAGFDSQDIIDQIETGAMSFAMFDVENGSASYKGEDDSIEEEDMIKYKYLVDQALKVISKDDLTYLKYFVINTDGKDNILAYVSQEDETLTKWRMVLDIKDAYDKDVYIKEYDETIVHEYGHILSLNSDQMQNESEGTYENEEGVLSKNSYLNKFYQKFWLDIYEEHQNSVDGNDQSGDQAYSFYEKYENQFVSDYAATNPEEDFAETFRVFVFEDMPNGNEIKDHKVLWMFSDDTLVKLRNSIRSNLKL